MKIDSRIPKKLASERSGFLAAPIGIDRPESKLLKAGDYASFKCRADPANADSPTHEIKVPYFRNGTAEEWFLFLRKFEQAAKGQALTSGPALYNAMRRLLIAESLAQFNAKAAELGNETAANYKACVQHVTDYVLPKRALRIQKRYLRRICRKPATMRMKEYIARYQEMNEYLAMFTPDGAANKLPEDEIIENLEFAIPTKWRKAMIMHGFDPVEHDIGDMVEFCERLETTEDIHDSQFKDKNNGKPNGEKPSKRKVGGPRAGTDGEKRTAKFNCLYHGPNATHGTDDCLVLKDQAKKMAAAHANLDRRNKRGRFENKTWKRDSGNDKPQSKGELHAYIQNMVDNAVKQSEKKRKADDPPAAVDLDEFNYDICDLDKELADFKEKLELSDDDE